jgi:hypothetical protein
MGDDQRRLRLHVLVHPRRVLCFGSNSEGQLGDDAGLDSPTPIAVAGL